jgi:hypothetical protein
MTAAHPTCPPPPAEAGQRANIHDDQAHHGTPTTDLRIAVEG